MPPKAMTRPNAFKVYFLAALTAVCYYILAYHTQREDFFSVIILYGLPFLFLWGIMKWSDEKRDYIPLSVIGIALRAGLILALPALSDDFYRFVWDGNLMLAGENPYSLLPAQMMGVEPSLPGINEVQFALLNSKEYFSVYPPLLQWVFWLGAKMFPNDLSGAVVVMKTVVFIAEIGTILLLPRLAKAFGLSRKATLLYTLNPLVIIELSANIHWEVLMIFFLAATLWLLHKKWVWLGAVAFSLAVGAKLIPLMFLPFLVKRLGWKRAIAFGAIVGTLVIAQFYPYFDLQTSQNFFSSISLYFQKFEFNASIYYLISKPLSFTGINLLLGKVFPIFIAGTICFWAWKEIKTDQSNGYQPDAQSKWASWAVWMLFSLSLYYLLATTVHPWYLTTFVFFAAITRFRYPIVWAILIPFTYITYHNQSFQQSWIIIIIEYSALFAFAWYEIVLRFRGKNLGEWVLEKPKLKAWLKKTVPPRLEIKKDRILRHLKKGEKTLDIGAGHGGMALTLRNAGILVEAVDVKDISLFEEVKPVIYGGKHLPFSDDEFETALLITVLHHTPDPELILRQAMRVAPRVVIMEDIYGNSLQKQLTFFTDSLVNLEFEGHPHTNKNDAGWQELFEKLGLKITFREDFRTLLFFRQVIYVVERKKL